MRTLQFLIAAFLVASAIAQTPRVSVRSSGGQGIGKLALSQTILPQLSAVAPARLRPVNNEMEAHLVSAASEVARGTIVRTFTGPARCSPLIQPTFGDVLLCSLGVTGSGEPAWLWDTHRETTLILAVPAATISPSALPGFLEQLLPWDRAPVSLNSVELSFNGIQTGAGAEVAAIGRNTPPWKSLSWNLQGAVIGGQGYLAVSATKTLFGDPRHRGLYREESMLAERFPPLANRLRSQGRGALLAELSNRKPDIGRDTVVFTEVLSRGPIQAVELQAIVFDNLPTGPPGPFEVHARIVSILRASARSGSLAKVAPALESLLTNPRSSNRIESTSVSNIFGTMGRAEIEFSRVALNLLERNQFQHPSLHYLATHARDRAALSRLSIMKVAPQFESARQHAVETMERRIGATAP